MTTGIKYPTTKSLFFFCLLKNKNKNKTPGQQIDPIGPQQK